MDHSTHPTWLNHTHPLLLSSRKSERNPKIAALEGLPFSEGILCSSHLKPSIAEKSSKEYSNWLQEEGLSRQYLLRRDTTRWRGKIEMKRGLISDTSEERNKKLRNHCLRCNATSAHWQTLICEIIRKYLFVICNSKFPNCLNQTTYIPAHRDISRLIILMNGIWRPTALWLC